MRGWGTTIVPTPLHLTLLQLAHDGKTRTEHFSSRTVELLAVAADEPDRIHSQINRQTINLLCSHERI